MAPKTSVTAGAAKEAEAEAPKVEETSTGEEPKAEEPKAEEPKAEDAEMKAEDAPEEPAAPAELEEDAAAPKGPTLKAGEVQFYTEDTTINVLPTVNGKLLTSLSDGGFQYLLAGARANVGVKAGRYLFEVMIAESKNVAEPAGARQQGPKPKQLVRVGFATSEASLLLGDGAEGVCFDTDGLFINGRQRSKVAKRFGLGQAAAVLLNLDASSPNANTISLFVDGVRASKPIPLPEHLKGKALFPAVTYRNVTLQVHFGPKPLRPLPFVALTLQQAAVADVQVKAAPAAPKDGKYEVVLPIGLPDEGTFDYLDQWLAKNKGYTELSDRAILDWAAKSGLSRQGGYAKRTSNDKPEFAFGLPLLDDGSVSKILAAVAPALPRNFVVAEVKGNLLADERKAVVQRFSGPGFKTVAHVVVGKPPAEFTKAVHEGILEEKRSKAVAELRRKKAEAARKKAEEERKKKIEEDRKKRLEAAKKAKEAKKEGEEAEEKKEEEPKAEEEPEKKEEPEEEKEEDIKVELTDEEKASLYRKRETPDLAAKDLSLSYTKFSLPSAEEGFDAITYAWSQEAEAKAYLDNWVLERKLTQRAEDLQPSEWFKAKFAEWSKLLGSWKRKQQDLKDPAKRKAAALAKKKELEAKKAEKGEGEGEDDAMGEEPKEIDVENLDVFAVEDVTDIGNGEPLFMNFVFEDWTLCAIRFELQLLVHAFRKDLDDPQRTNFHENHLPFYYNKYFKKPFNVKYFGVKELSELVELIKETVQINPTNHTLETSLAEDTPLENFVKLTEDHRRDRQRRVDAGDETAKLKFSRPAPAAPKQPQQPPKGSSVAATARAGGYGSARVAPVQPTGRGSYYSAAGGAPAARSTYGQSSAAASSAGQKRPYSATAGGYAAYSAYPAAKQPRPSDAYSRGSAYPAPAASSWRGRY